ncbi:helix-turn-helix domain-containing protein [Sinobaca qinghaiensis]
MTYTVAEASEIVGISRHLLYKMIKNGEAPACKVGRRILIKKDSLDKWLNNLERT